MTGAAAFAFCMVALILLSVCLAVELCNALQSIERQLIPEILTILFSITFKIVYKM